MKKININSRRFIYSTSVRPDPKDIFQTFRNTNFKQPPIVSGAQGFGDFIQNTDNEVQPWNTTPEFEGSF
jgi:hypothetical protein